MKTLMLAVLYLLSVPALAAPAAAPSNPLNYAADQSVPPVASQTPLAKNHPHPHKTPVSKTETPAKKSAQTAPKKHKTQPQKTIKCRDGSQQRLRLNCAPHGGVARS